MLLGVESSLGLRSQTTHTHNPPPPQDCISSTTALGWLVEAVPVVFIRVWRTIFDFHTR